MRRPLSAAEEPGYATIYEPRKHQQRSRQQFLDACAEQVEQLLQIIKGEEMGRRRRQDGEKTETERRQTETAEGRWEGPSTLFDS